MIELHERNVAIYQQDEIVTDVTTGEVLSETHKTITKSSTEPDFIKVYYETMMAFNRIHDIPVSFVLSMAKYLEWTNEGKPSVVTLNKRVKENMSADCGVATRQIDRYIKQSVENGLLFRTQYRSVYEVNPFMIAKGKWDSIKKLRAEFDFVGGKWTRTIVNDPTDQDDQEAANG